MVWAVRQQDAAGWRLPSPSPEDLADAAQAKRDGGAPRLLRRRLLRALVARLFDLRPDAIRFVRERGGALRLAGLVAGISATGCRGWSMVAVAPGGIGVDIETEEGALADLARWTLVEAYLKALGAGLTIAPETVGVAAAGPTAAGAVFSIPQAAFDLSLSGLRSPPGRGWLHAPAPGVVAAVVVLCSERHPPLAAEPA